jgi:hypothetical protein
MDDDQATSYLVVEFGETTGLVIRYATGDVAVRGGFRTRGEALAWIRREQLLATVVREPGDDELGAS